MDQSDVRLTSYWDVLNCGPAGDDHNSDWCGGNTNAPECKDVVETDVCVSGKARLKSLLGGDGGNGIFQDQCLFVFYAQYVCEAPSTTTTTTSKTSTGSSTTTSVTSTLTNTTTTSSTATNTTTVTTTTTVVTTTAVLEGKLLKATKEFEASLLEGEEWSADAMLPYDCDSRWKPPDPPQWATDFNGIHLPDVCFRSKGPHRVFVIGDWGGVLGESGPVPANQRPEESFVWGVDDNAQVRVANQMMVRANITSPDYILNAGDNFYWGGLEVACGVPAWQVVPLPQFEWNFEKIYTGPLAGKPWLGVLGNHDYGGFAFQKGWDQLIAYTWGPGGRWVMPAQYYRSVVRYPGFSVDYFFMDTNVNNAAGVGEDVHNICSSEHNPPDASCGEEGPKDIGDCPVWFIKLWEDQQEWVEKGLAESTADWQVIVTHYPPTWRQEFWVDLSRRHGVDLFVTGHIHSQNLHHLEDGNFLSPTAWIVSGGGGGITSEAEPDPDGNDNQYGFYELTLSKEVIQIQGFSHGGQKQSETFLKQRHPERKKSVVRRQRRRSTTSRTTN